MTAAKLNKNSSRDISLTFFVEKVNNLPTNCAIFHAACIKTPAKLCSRRKFKYITLQLQKIQQQSASWFKAATPEMFVHPQKLLYCLDNFFIFPEDRENKYV